MSSLRTDRVAFDSNIYVHASLGTPGKDACAELVFERIHLLHIFIPEQVVRELHRNLRAPQQQAIYDALAEAAEVSYNFERPAPGLLSHYRSLGMVKGDAIICAILHSGGIRWLVSENRDFLRTRSDLPFAILSAEEALERLTE